MIYNILYSNGNRDNLVNMIKNKRSEQKFTVIDVGGTTNCWTSEFTDAICDILSFDTDKIKVFKININLPNEWKEVDDINIIKSVISKEIKKIDDEIKALTLKNVMLYKQLENN